MRLRQATLADLALLRHWSAQPHILAATDDDWEWEHALAPRSDWGEHLIAELEGRPIGYLQIIDPAREEDHYWGDCPQNLRAIDIWIGEERDLGRGLGTQMMQLALARCFAPPEVEAVLVDPLLRHERVHPFYRRLGFRFVGVQRLGDDDCAIFRLERSDWREQK